MKGRANTLESMLALLEPIEGIDCLVWTGWIDKNGYGTVHFSGATRFVHRIIWEQQKGPIPDGFVIDHLCRVRPCANIHHLEVVTQKQNILRGESCFAQQARQTHCINGHIFLEANTHYRVTGSKIMRQCRTCDAVRHQAARRRLREQIYTIDREES